MQLLRKLLGRGPGSEGIFGVSFLAQGVAVAISQYSTENTVTLSHCEFIPIADSTVSEQTLNKLTRQYKLGQYDCHLVLSASDYRLTNIEAPAVADNEMRDAIRWKINELIDFPIDTTNIDFYPMPAAKHTSAAKILTVVASPNEVLKRQIELCLKAEWRLQVIDIQETVIRNLAVLLPENERGIAVLHLQQSAGMIIIQKSGTLYLSRKVDIGYEQLDLAASVDADSRAQQQRGNLALEIQRSMDYFESYYGMPAITGLAVVPMPGNTQELLNFLNSSHGITARIMDLSAIVDCNIMLDDTTQSYCAAAIGATLRYALEAA